MTMVDEPSTKISKITDSINRDVLGTIKVASQSVDHNQLLDLAKTMATAVHSIPKHLRGNLGDCLYIRELAQEVGLSAYGLAQHCHVINDVLGFDGQAIHAIIERHAPLEQRLRFKFAGEGDTRTCTVSGIFKNEVDACEYTSPQIGKITPQNSSLWRTDPDQQLSYFSVRRWAKRYCPDIIMGVFATDELEDNPHIGAENAKDVSPNLMERLPGKIEGAGFAENVVDQALAQQVDDEQHAKYEEARRKLHNEGKEDAKKKPKNGKKKKEEEAAAEPVTITVPTTAAEYVTYCQEWQASTMEVNALSNRWHDEGDMRDQLKVPIKDRGTLYDALDKRIADLQA